MTNTGTLVDVVTTDIKQGDLRESFIRKGLLSVPLVPSPRQIPSDTVSTFVWCLDTEMVT